MSGEGVVTSKVSRHCDKGRCVNVGDRDRGASAPEGNIGGSGSGGRCGSAGSSGLRLTPDGYRSEESLNDSPMRGGAIAGGGGYASGGSGSAGSIGTGCCRQPQTNQSAQR